jgi:hypothetical protein
LSVSFVLYFSLLVCHLLHTPSQQMRGCCQLCTAFFIHQFFPSRRRPFRVRYRCVVYSGATLLLFMLPKPKKECVCNPCCTQSVCCVLVLKHCKFSTESLSASSVSVCML